MLKVLFVDDMESAKNDFAEALEIIGVEASIDYRRPVDRSVPFGCEMPTPAELSQFDVAIVDLELFPPSQSLVYHPEDLRGGSEVLPFLRREAPWLPVVGFSRLFGGQAKHFLAVAGSFGFDGYLPRQVVEDDFFDRTFWSGFLQRVQRIRDEALLGEAFTRGEDVPEIETTEGLRTRLTTELPTWEAVLRRCFYFADRAVIEEISGGLSGARTLQVYTRSSLLDFAKESVWLLKMSGEPAKLLLETRAHTERMQAGLEYARSVPLLWRWPVVVSGGGGIAYQFARGTEPAASMAETLGDSKETAGRVRRLLEESFEDRGKSRGVRGVVLRDWLPNPEALRKGLSVLDDCPFKDFLLGVNEGDDRAGAADVLEYQRAWIHGDLHLGNILLGERDVLIDFAHSRAGPVAVDIGRLVADLAIRIPAVREADAPFLSADLAIMGEIRQVLRDMNCGEDDEVLASDVCGAWLTASLGFGTLEEEVWKVVREKVMKLGR